MTKYKLSNTGKKQLEAIPDTKIVKNGHTVYLKNFTDQQVEAIGSHVFFVRTQQKNKQKSKEPNFTK